MPGQPRAAAPAVIHVALPVERVSLGYVARVIVPSPALLRETDALRCELEGLAARRFVAYASSAQLEAMRRATVDFRVLAEHGADSGDLLWAHDRFYHVLLRGAGGVNTITLLAQLRAQVSVVVCAGLADPARARKMSDELSVIYEALAAGDVDAALAACTRHIDRTREVGLDLLGLALT